MRRILFAYFCLQIIPFRAGAATSEGRVFVAGGSGANVPLIEALAQSYRKKGQNLPLKLLSGISSAGGLRGVSEGRIDLGLIMSSLKTAEKNPDLVLVPYAKSAQVIIAHRAVVDVDTSISDQDLIDIYGEKRAIWNDGSEINVIMRERGDVGAEVLMEVFPALKPVFENAWSRRMWRIEFSEKASIRTISKIKYSVGWSDLTYIEATKPPVKLMKLNGIEPNPENVISGRYPLVRQMSFVYREPLAPELKSFIKFVKSGAGGKIISQYKGIPVE